jgi:hypothetical protein
MNAVTETTVSNATALVERYLAIWNERDATRRRALIAQSWTEDASYIDPLMHGDGHAGIDAMIQAVQDRFVGHRFHLLKQADAYGNYIRFSWELAPEGGAMLVGGSDFATVADDGRLQSVVGFLDHVPANA